MKFTASRLSEGNKVFPAEIIIEPNGLTVKIPGLFSGKSKHLDYQNIGEVSIDAPVIGYSTITFFTAGTKVSAHGFTSNEVKKIRQAIEKGKQGFTNSNNFHSTEPQITAEQILAEAKAEHLEYELEKKKKHDNSLKPWLNDSNFKNKTSINAISFPNNIEDAEKTVERIIKVGVEEIKKVLSEFNATAIQHTLGDRNFFKPYSEEFEMVEVCIEKAREGIKKLKRKDETEHPKLKYIITDLEENFLELKETWFPKLEEQRVKKKRKNITVLIVIIVANILFWGGLGVLSK
jgi:hypothetical protein